MHLLACQAAVGITNAAGGFLLRPDERGFLALVQAVPDGVPAELVQAAATSLHHRWIAAHGSGAAETTPYRLEKRRNLLIAPMISGDSLAGGLAVLKLATSSQAGFLLESAYLAAIACVGSQAIDAIQLRRRIDHAMSAADLDIELAKARKEIARELHDGPAQELALTGYAIDRIVKRLEPGHPAILDAREARECVDRAILAIRSAIGNARERRPAAASLTGPLRELLSEIKPAAREVEVSFQEVSGLSLAPEVERAMVGIVREALHNVRKHSHADSARLDVRRIDDAIEISVTDDGVGFSGDVASGHFGLDQIRELAEETGGRIAIGKMLNGGASVRAWIPLPNTEAAQASEPNSQPSPGRRLQADLAEPLRIPQEAPLER